MKSISIFFSAIVLFLQESSSVCIAFPFVVKRRVLIIPIAGIFYEVLYINEGHEIKIRISLFIHITNTELVSTYILYFHTHFIIRLI